MTKFSISKINLPIYKNAKLWFIVPLVILALTIIIGTIYQIVPTIDKFANIGIDFQGGTVLTVEMSGADMNEKNYETNVTMIEDIVKANGLGVSVKQASGTNAIIVRYTNVVNGVSYNNDDKTKAMNELNSKISSEVTSKFTSVYGEGVTITASASLTGASASSKLLQTAFLSVGIALILILIYVMLRFDPYSGLSAILALLHDVLMMLCFTVIFRIQINSSIVAGVITIVSYSINNTIIIFDRVRETVKPYKAKNAKFDVGLIVDSSVKETLTRSIYTTLTTLFTITTLAFLGVAAIKEFAFPILFGLIAGLYSSVFIAPSAWGLLTERKMKGPKKKLPSTTIAKKKKSSKAIA